MPAVVTGGVEIAGGAATTTGGVEIAGGKRATG